MFNLIKIQALETTDTKILQTINYPPAGWLNFHLKELPLRASWERVFVSFEDFSLKVSNKKIGTKVLADLRKCSIRSGLNSSRQNIFILVSGKNSFEFQGENYESAQAWIGTINGLIVVSKGQNQGIDLSVKKFFKQFL